MALRFLSPIHRAGRQVGLYLAGHTGRLAVSNAEGHLLSYLRSYGPCPIGDLHHVFGLKRSTLTSMLDRLEERALLRRELDPEDRRSFHVELTPAGRKVADRLQAALDDLEAAIRGRITGAELAGFDAVMRAIGEATGVEVRPERRGVEPGRTRRGRSAKGRTSRGRKSPERNTR